MPKERISLSLAYLRLQPEAAARALEQHSPQDISKFLKDLPFDAATASLSNLMPRLAARVIEDMGPEIAKDLLAGLEGSSLAAILRHVDAAFRKAIVGQLPANRQKLCQTLLRFNEDQAGAWMMTQIPIIPRDVTVADAAQMVAEFQDAIALNRYYVVNRQGQLLGSLSIPTLLSARRERRVEDFLIPATDRIEARASIESLEEAPIWGRGDAFPVVDLKGRLLGVLRHSELRKSLSHNNLREVPSDNHHIIPTIVEEYANTLWSLGSSMVSEYTGKY